VADETWPLACHRCGAELSPGEGSFYVVRIEAFADPSPPPLDVETPLGEISRQIDDLMAAMATMSEQELMDQVHRRLVLLRCARCYRTWIEDPVGGEGA
jgi:hypothetical protein